MDGGNQLTCCDRLPEDRNDDPLKWWARRASQMPHLAEFAKDVFSIPGSSHALERAFSRAGRAVDPRKRSRLAKESAADLIFCHENRIRSVF